MAFQNQGTFFGAGNGGNNHSDTFTYKGETYFTYHAQTRGAAWAAALGTPGATQGYRSVHIDKLEFNVDGTIKPVVGTKAGVEQVESFDPYRTFEAETLAWQLGITTTKTDAASVEFPEHNGSGNMVLSGVDDGDFSGISGVDFGSGAQKVSAKVKPLVAGSSIQVRLDDVDGPVVAEIPVDGTVGEWTTVEADVTGATGEHDVFFVLRRCRGHGCRDRPVRGRQLGVSPRSTTARRRAECTAVGLDGRRGRQGHRDRHRRDGRRGRDRYREHLPCTRDRDDGGWPDRGDGDGPRRHDGGCAPHRAA